MTTATATLDDQQQSDPLLQLAATHEAAILALELQVAHALSWPLRARLAALDHAIAAQWPTRTGTAATPVDAAVRARAVRELNHLIEEVDGRRVAAAVLDAATRAAALGNAQALEQIAVQTAGPRTPFVRVQTPLAPTEPWALQPPVRAVATAAGKTAAVHLRDAAKALTTAETPAQARAAIAVAERAPNALETATGWAVNRASDDSVRAAAARQSAQTLWIAERDACVVCLALSGTLADPLTGEGFDEEATFGAPGSAMPVWPPGQPLLAPPRHPHCRCHIVVWLGTAPGRPDLPETLRREALRSILRGFSRPSESHRVRVAAAERLLRGGQAAHLPKSVRAYAASAVLAGRFPTRDVPRWPSDQPRRAA